jgi:hypothetical protein
MAEKSPVQAMGGEAPKGAPDGTNQPGPGPGPSEGGPYPNPHTGKERPADKERSPWRGGQSVQGYHGPQQLGEQEITPGGNQNEGSRG